LLLYFTKPTKSGMCAQTALFWSQPASLLCSYDIFSHCNIIECRYLILPLRYEYNSSYLFWITIVGFRYEGTNYATHAWALELRIKYFITLQWLKISPLQSKDAFTKNWKNIQIVDAYMPCFHWPGHKIEVEERLSQKDHSLF